ncbi:NADH-ubiquinone oxidoreductase chain [Hibiscus syriacus]|uniref:NADH-ubiquinone oxidoreductase chain n=1 Tax=Hibiscus syriacus TaxID=106335 RepID=A0A6A3C3S5_HIBSY|nr:NADH-ubiquinone oxidoreductase chain [Hibiscus syriacus]
MGNCLRRPSSAQWDGDNWETSAAEDGAGPKEKGPVRNRQKDGFITTSSTAITTTTREVKVKITKKQLEELLGRVDVNELSVQQVLAQLINFDIQANQRSWTPRLQSIPEVN